MLESLAYFSQSIQFSESTGAIAIISVFVIFLTLFLVLTVGGLCFCLCCCLHPVSTVAAITSCVFGICLKKDDKKEALLYQRVADSSSIDYSNTSLYIEAEEYNGMDEAAVLTDAYVVPPLVAHAEKNHYYDHQQQQQQQNGLYTTTSSSTIPILDTPTTHKHTTQVVKYFAAFKDIWFGALFIANVLIVMIFALKYSIVALSMKQFRESKTVISSILLVSGILAVVATVIGTGILSCILNYAETIIVTFMWFNIIITVTGAVITLLNGSVVFAVVLLVISVFNYVYLISVRDRVPFASATLKVATKGLSEHYYSVMLCAYIILFLQISWFIAWTVAFAGISQSYDITHSSGIIVFFLLVLSLHWGCQVMSCVYSTTVGGVIAAWFFGSSGKSNSNAVSGSLFRSLTYSFGSICLGALLVSLVTALRELLHMAAGKRNNYNRRGGSSGVSIMQALMFCIVDNALRMVESLMTYFNKYSFSYIAAWGTSYIESSKRVMQLFTDKGWTAIINDNLINNVLTMTSLSLAFITGITGYLLATVNFLNASNAIQNVLVIYTLLGTAIGFLVGLMLTTSISASVASLFVCYAEQSDALESSHPEEYHELTVQWMKLYPAAATIPHAEIVI